MSKTKNKKLDPLISEVANKAVEAIIAQLLRQAKQQARDNDELFTGREPLDGDNVDEIVDAIRIKLNVHEGNI